jgi:hypothetical protein
VASRDTGQNNIGAFREEGAVTIPKLALTQRRRPFDESVLRTAEWFA